MREEGQSGIRFAGGVSWARRHIHRKIREILMDCQVRRIS
jgi:hypothetical protein